MLTHGQRLEVELQCARVCREARHTPGVRMNPREGASRFGAGRLDHLRSSSFKKIEVRFVLRRRQDFLHRPFFTSFNRLKFTARSSQLVEHRLCIRIDAIFPEDHCHFAVRLGDYVSHLRALVRAELHAL